MKFVRKSVTLALVLALALGLAVPAMAVGASPKRGELSCTQHIAPKYENAKQFGEEGLAPVKLNGKWGYIDETGKVVIDFQYDYAWAFSEGYAIVGNVVHIDEGYRYSPDGNDDDSYDVYDVAAFGFIDKNNTYKEFTANSESFYLPLYLVTALDTVDLFFHNGYFWLDYDIFNANGQAVIPKDNSLLCDGPMNEGLIPLLSKVSFSSGFMDTDGNIVKTFPSDEESLTWISVLSGFHQGLAAVALCHAADESDEEYGGTEYVWRLGFIDRNYNWVITPQYQFFYSRNHRSSQETFGPTGLAAVQNTSGKWGAIDKAGKTVIPFQYDLLGVVSNGLIPFSSNGKYGFLDAATYQPVIPARYDDITAFSNELGLAAVLEGKNAYLIDKNGNKVPGSETLNADTYFPCIDFTCTPNQYTVIQENGKYGYGKLEYLPPLPAQSEMDSWAYEEVTAAIEENLVPVYLQNLYRNKISREEFCDLVIQSVTEMTDKDLAALVQEESGKSLSTLLHSYPFTDTSSRNIIAANALGIINGRGNGIFDPYTSITREEAAVLLMRAAKVLGLDTSDIQSANFADDKSIGSVFKDGVNYVRQIGVMSGVGSNRFDPKGTYTRQQSFMTAHRLLQALEQEQGE